MEELEALNLLLRAIGSSPVKTVKSTHPDAANAVAALTRIRKQSQSRGWWFNVDYDVTFSTAADGTITLSDKITKITFDDTDIVKRGNKVYHRRDRTYVFDASLVASMVQYALTWDELPDSLQRHIAYYAGSQFIRDEIEDSIKVQEFQVEAANALLDVREDDLAQGRYNVFEQGRVAVARMGVRPYGRN